MSRRDGALFLGRTIETFRPTMTNVVAGGILSALLFTFGCGILATVFVVGRRQAANGIDGAWWIAVCLWSAIGLVAIAGAFGLARYARRLAMREVQICEHGLRCVYRQGVVESTWDSLRTVRETIFYEPLPMLNLPVGSRRFTVVLADGSEHTFDGNAIARLGRFAKLLRQQIAGKKVNWIIAYD
jgi:hypothetical protein